jgi:glutamate synthase (NADPH/NADH)
MEFLRQNTKALLDSKCAGGAWREKSNGNFIDAKNKRVIVVGGGDTGNDCIGTSVRHGAKSVVNFELLPPNKEQRQSDNPWPQWPRVWRVDYGHAEVESRDGKDPRQYLVLSKRFVGNDEGQVTGIETVRVEWAKDASGRFQMKEVEGSEQLYEADLIFLAMGFMGPEQALLDALELPKDPRSNIAATFGPGGHKAKEKIFAAGDCRRGQSLVVWAIREGREAAKEVDKFLN